MMKFNFFRVDDTLKSYTYPIIKILICIVLIIFLINRNYFFHIEKMSSKFIFGAICICIGIASILCIYISAAEMLIIHDNRSKTDSTSVREIDECKMCSIDEVVSLVNNNDIIEIQIISNGRIVEIGASSDCKAGSSKFFDKLFFICEEEFLSIEDFKNSLLSYSTDGTLFVMSIDGIKPK